MWFKPVNRSWINHTLLVAGVVFYWILSLIFFYNSEVPADAGDGIAHFQIARFAFQHPANFMDHWGKPLYTILAAPFAQMGLIGMVIFNLILFSLTSWLLFKIARHFTFNLPGISPFILMSSMLYFKMVNAGLTEILFGFIAILGLYLFIKEKAGWACIVVSLSMVVRPESVVLIPVFGVVILLRNNWKQIPLLATGFIIFTLIGWLAFSKNPLWLIMDDPYAIESPYGSGDPTHFLRNSDLIFGPFTLILSAILVLLYVPLHFKNIRSSRLSQSLLVALSCVLLVLALHMFLWWQGLKGSYGLLRVMATIVPLAAFAAHYLFHLASSWKFQKIIGGVLFGVLTISCINAVKKSEIPTHANPYQKVQTEAAMYFKQIHKGKRLAYLEPFFGYKTGIDPFEETEAIFLWSVNSDEPSASLAPGDYLVWDSKYGPVEGRMKEEAVTQNPNINVLKTFESDKPLNGSPYRIHIARVKGF